jgi:AraC-like DNA-binding protein
MPLSNNLWYLGAQFMASIQARDHTTAQRQLRTLLRLIARESRERFSYYKLRTLQVLTNANRAAFNAGASTEQLAAHSLQIIEHIDRVDTPDNLEQLALDAVNQTIAMVPAGSAYQERIVQEAIRYIRDHFSENISRNELAARLHCSAAHFSRVFTRTTGYAYRDFLLQCRIEKAKELLCHSHLQVAEVANAVGYEDPFQFSKVFRKRSGVSPRQFRDSRHERPELDPSPGSASLDLEHERAPKPMSLWQPVLLGCRP